MGLRIRTNVMSLVSQRHLNNSTVEQRKHMERLSSGARINRAADDAAGLAIAEVLRSDVRSLNQARRNTSDGISLIQVAEGSLNEVTNIIIRLKELAIQGASDTIGNRERGYLNLEFMALKDEVDRITLTTEYNSHRLLVGKTKLPEELDRLNEGPPLEVQVDKEYHPLIDGLNVPNPVNIIRLDFSEMNSLTEGEGSLGLGNPRNPEGTSVETKQQAQRSVTVIEEAIQKVSGYRARLGALQNRLESAERNLGIRVEGLASARSRIFDADFAQETAEFTQMSILQQAGASILSQANQLPNVALQLLQN